MAKQVLIVIDNAKRELFGCSLLKLYLKSLGVNSILCSRFSFSYYYARYAPELVVWPNALWDLSEVAEKSFVFVLPSESGNGQPDLVRAIHVGTAINPVYPECVDRFFCWGPAMREILLESGKWRDEQLVVTGNPSTDHWVLPRPGVERSKRRIGLTTTFRALSNYTPLSKMNYFEWLDQAEATGGDGTYFEPPEHAETWVFFEASLARVISGLIRALAVKYDKKVDIRPHPGELKSRYAYLRRISNGRVLVTKAGTVSEWLSNISVLFTYLSASAVDAVIRGIPVVSLKGLLDVDALRKIPRHYHYSYDDWFWQVNSLGEAVDYAELAERGKLEPCRDKHRFANFASDHYLFPRPEPAARQIAVEIKKTLTGTDRQKQALKRSTTGRAREDFMDMLCHRIPLSAQLMGMARYVYGLIPGHLYIGSTYQPWRAFERWEAMRSAASVQAAVAHERGQLSRVASVAAERALKTESE